MNYEFILEKGKHKGKTVGWVEDNDPDYMVWAEECAPSLLGEGIEGKPYVKIEYKEPEMDEKESVIKPNLNFDNEEHKNYY